MRDQQEACENFSITDLKRRVLYDSSIRPCRARLHRTTASLPAGFRSAKVIARSAKRCLWFTNGRETHGHLRMSAKK